MRIICPFCGNRQSVEFSYIGDATLADRPSADLPDAAARFLEYTYIRGNPAGRHVELWWHGMGCRELLRVVRDTRTHEIEQVSFATDGVKSSGTSELEQDVRCKA
jgi:heterotetrameric sarcosine oxidase delta subunit